MKNNLKYQLYDLTPQKFEEFCADLLNAEYQFDKFFITNGPNDNGVDILALKGLKKLAVQIKHRYKIHASQLGEEIERYKSLLEFHHEFIYLTSAPLSKEVIVNFGSDKIRIISQREIFEMLDKHTDVAQRYFAVVEKKIQETRRWFSASVIGSVLSIMISLLTLFLENQSKEKPLTERINNVEQALNGIKALEQDLESIKSDMIETNLENKRILAEYERMKGLEDIVNEKKESLISVLNYQPWYEKALNYFLGIITGVFTSIVASILYERWKLRRELKK
jgi:hypothetical protein